MPKTRVLFYQDDRGRAPVVEWLRHLRRSDVDAYDKCAAKIARLQEEGSDLRRPEADYLDDGIYELRAQRQRNQYRILYFFHGQDVAVLHHALARKTNAVPPQELRRAKERRHAFKKNPDKHTYGEEEDF
jgi:phage-related protein